MGYKAEKIKQTEMPKTLNGHPVKAFTISKDEGRALVLVDRGIGRQPWVAATWWPELKDEWQWGNYFASYEEAESYRGWWIKTHGNHASAKAIRKATQQQRAINQE